LELNFVPVYPAVASGEGGLIGARLSFFVARNVREQLVL
jgi:hypothetical protein